MESKNSGFYVVDDELKLNYRIWEPRNDIDLMMIIVHGIAEHSGRYEKFAKYLNKNNILVVSYDLMGHGNSTGKRSYISDFSKYVDQLKEMYNFFYNKYKKEVLILGHSMGGIISSLFAEKYAHNLQGLILSSPAFRVNMYLPKTILRMLDSISNILPGIKIKRLDPELLSRNKEVVNKYKNDEKVYGGRLPLRTSLEIIQAGEKSLKNIDHISCPVFTLFGEKDEIIDTEIKGSGLNNINNKKEMKIYPEYYHEILNEINSQQVYEDIYNWISKIS